MNENFVKIYKKDVAVLLNLIGEIPLKYGKYIDAYFLESLKRGEQKEELQEEKQENKENN